MVDTAGHTNTGQGLGAKIVNAFTAWLEDRRATRIQRNFAKMQKRNASVVLTKEAAARLNITGAMQVMELIGSGVKLRLRLYSGAVVPLRDIAKFGSSEQLVAN